VAKRPTYDEKTWSAIRKEWIAGQLSLTEISASFGPSRPAIRGHAQRYDWPPRGSLVEAVRQSIKTELLADDNTPADVPPAEAGEIIESATKRGVTVVRKHRQFISRLFGILDGTLSELENMEAKALEIVGKRSKKARLMAMQMVSKARFDGMKIASQVLSQAIPLERQAFSLDDDAGQATAIRYVAPDYKKPRHAGLSEDDWDQEENDED